MKQSEVRKLSESELQEQLNQYKKTYAEMKMSHAITPLQNPLELRKVRRVVARLSCELTKRELQ